MEKLKLQNPGAEDNLKKADYYFKVDFRILIHKTSVDLRL